MMCFPPGSPRPGLPSGAKARLKHLLEHGLPLPDPEAGAREAAKLIKACSADELAALGLQPPPPPPPGGLTGDQLRLPLEGRLRAVQDVIDSLQYNYAPAGYNYDVDKGRHLPAILATASGMLRAPLPIKCIEAVFLGLRLTQGWPEAPQRLPLGFKSVAGAAAGGRGCGGGSVGGRVHRHIVLAVRDGAHWGALGLSRRPNLGFKELQYPSLSELVADYVRAYSSWQHAVDKVRVGLPVEHGAGYAGPVCWRFCSVSPARRPWTAVAAKLDRHAGAAAERQLEFAAAASAAAEAAEAAAAAAARAQAQGQAQAAAASRAAGCAPPASPRCCRAGAGPPGRASPGGALWRSRELPGAASPQACAGGGGGGGGAPLCARLPGPAAAAAPGPAGSGDGSGSGSCGGSDGDGDGGRSFDSDSEVNVVVAAMRRRRC